MIASNHSEALLRDCAAALASAGASSYRKPHGLSIFILRLEERAIAGILAFRNSTTIFGYLSGFDPAYTDFCFSRELLAQAFHHAHAHQYRWCDFLRGEEPYKFLWGAERISKRRVVFEPRHANCTAQLEEFRNHGYQKQILSYQEENQ
jgi:CelD/BcsL family acetyltransferase involved in cellulose biosynthesis